MSLSSPREISGRTRVLFILAEPVAHVRTPQVMNALAARRGVDCVMAPCEVAADGLGAVLAAMRMMKSVDGAVVTMPHKNAAAALCDELSEHAAAAGAVNAIRRTPQGALAGDIFDGKGMVAGLAASRTPLADECALLVGAGGAASAIAFALAYAGVRRLVIHNRTQDKARRLAEAVSARFPQVEAVASSIADPTGASLVVNASMLGMRTKDPLPVDVERLTPEMTVADVVMQVGKTRLLQEAERRGCRIQPGQIMLQHQLEMLADFLGLAAPRAADPA